MKNLDACGTRGWERERRPVGVRKATENSYCETAGWTRHRREWNRDFNPDDLVRNRLLETALLGPNLFSAKRTQMKIVTRIVMIMT